MRLFFLLGSCFCHGVLLVLPWFFFGFVCVGVWGFFLFCGVYLSCAVFSLLESLKLSTILIYIIELSKKIS